MGDRPSHFCLALVFVSLCLNLVSGYNVEAVGGQADVATSSTPGGSEDALDPHQVGLEGSSLCLLLVTMEGLFLPGRAWLLDKLPFPFWFLFRSPGVWFYLCVPVFSWFLDCLCTFWGETSWVR